MHKTGTSSIQSFLSTNSERLMSQKNILYVESGRDVNKKKMHAGHHRLAWSTVERYANRKDVEISKKVWESVLKEIEKKDPKLAVISSEFFWPAKPEEIKKIRYIIGKLNVKIVIYVRNQLDWARSTYIQIVKNEKYYKSIKNMIEERRWYFDVKKIVKKWEKIFGENNVVVKLYDKEKDSLLSGFVKLIGDEYEVEERSMQNVSPPNHIIHLIRALNVAERVLPSFFASTLRRGRRNILAQRQPGKILSKLLAPFLPATIMSPSDRDWFRQETKEMRDRFLESYVSPEDYHLFEI